MDLASRGSKLSHTSKRTSKDNANVITVSTFDYIVYIHSRSEHPLFKAMKAASAGSTIGMNILTSSINVMTMGQVTQVIGMLCSNFRIPNSSGTTFVPTFSEFLRAFGSLERLNIVLKNARERFDDTSRMTKAIPKFWGGLQFWLHYFVSSRSTHPKAYRLDPQPAIKSVDSSGKLAREQSPSSVVCIFLQFLLDDDSHVLRKLVVDDRTIFKIAAKLWIRQDSNIDYDHDRDASQWVRTFPPYPTTLLSRLFEESKNKNIGRDFIEIAERDMKPEVGDADFIASSAIARLRCALRVDPPQANIDVAHYLGLISNLILEREDCSELADALYKNGVIHVVTRAIRKLSNAAQAQGIDTEDSSIWLDPLATAIEFLSDSMEFAPSSTWARQAIRSGIVDAVSVFLDCEPGEELSNIAHKLLTKTIPGQMFSRCVTRDLVSAYRKSDFKLGGEPILRGPAAALDDLEWLRCFVIERRICRSFYHYMEARHKTCDSVSVLSHHTGRVLIFRRQCGDKFPRFTLKVCAVCKFRAYCSMECQRTAWSTGHKAECKFQAKCGIQSE